MWWPTSTSLAPPCLPPFVHLSSLKVDLNQSEARLFHSVRWSGWLRWSSRFILVHQSSSQFIGGWHGSRNWKGSWTLLEQPGQRSSISFFGANNRHYNLQYEEKTILILDSRGPHVHCTFYPGIRLCQKSGPLNLHNRFRIRCKMIRLDLPYYQRKKFYKQWYFLDNNCCTQQFIAYSFNLLSTEN